MSSQKEPGLIEIWNWKIHIYIGLYLLLFVWLFSVSGLILNHPKWQFAQFWSQRKQSSFEQPIQLPTETDDLAKARNLMKQLHISGEIMLTMAQPAEDHFDFRVIKPGKIIDIKADLNTNRATVEQIQVNAWGILNMLHSFTGVRMDDSKQTRDWFMTKIWSFSMDAVAVGLFALVFSGLYMWYRLKQKRRLGLIVLALGVLSCGLFVFGLGWMP